MVGKYALSNAKHLNILFFLFLGETDDEYPDSDIGDEEVPLADIHLLTKFFLGDGYGEKKNEMPVHRS